MKIRASKDIKNGAIDVEKIKRLCHEKNLSLAELGRRIGLDKRESISRRLQNNYTITGNELFLIADQLGISTDELRLG